MSLQPGKIITILHLRLINHLTFTNKSRQWDGIFAGLEKGGFGSSEYFYRPYHLDTQVIPHFNYFIFITIKCSESSEFRMICDSSLTCFKNRKKINLSFLNFKSPQKNNKLNNHK